MIRLQLCATTSQKTYDGLLIIQLGNGLLVLRSIQRLASPHWVVERQSGALLYGFIEERISGVEEIRAAWSRVLRHAPAVRVYA